MKKIIQNNSKNAIPFMHWLIISCSIILTIVIWRFSQNQVNLQIKNQFTKQAEQSIHLIRERLEKYEDALWVSIGLIKSYNNQINIKIWKSYIDNLNLLTKYPGINGIGIIEMINPNDVERYLTKQKLYRPKFKIHPKHNNKLYYPISYILPLLGNEKAVGLDMAHEKNRYTALIKSIESGLPQITRPIVLVQDKNKTPGFLLYVPYYKKMTYSTPKMLNESFLGAVYAPFIMNKFLDGVISADHHQINLQIIDNKSILYNEFKDENKYFNKNPLYKLTKKINIYGRDWLFILQESNIFLNDKNNSQPLTILISGIIIDLFLFMLFLNISRSKQNAIKYANEVNKDLVIKKNQLELSNKYKTEFLSNVSHELRTPLNSIILLSELILEDIKVDPETRESMTHIYKSGHNLLSLINEILDLSKIESGKILLKFSNIEISQIITELKNEFSTLCKNKGLNLLINIRDNCPTVIYTDPQRLKQILKNLLSNAIKFTEKGTIEILIQEEENNNNILLKQGIVTLSFSIIDSGIGIQQDNLSIIFESFQQVDGALNRKHTGTGLGLPISKKLAKLLGGYIKVDSEVYKGSTFSLFLPFK